jgi:hypothetical protein
MGSDPDEGWPSCWGQARDFPYEVQDASALRAGERIEFGKLGQGFAELAQEETDFQSGACGGAAQEPVVPDAGKAFGEDMEQPAANELVGMQAHDGGAAGVAGRPAQEDIARGIVSEEAFWMEGAALNVSGEVAQGGVSPPGMLELDVPSGAWSEGAAGIGTEFGVKERVLLFERLMETAAEPVGEGTKVHEEGVFGRMDKVFAFGVQGDGRDDEMHMRMLLHLAAPGVKDAGKSGATAFCFGGDDVAEGSGAFPEHEVVEHFGMGPGEGAQLGGEGEGHHEVGHGQEAGFLFGAPDLLIEGAALRAVAVVATVVGEVFLLAVFTAVKPPPHGGGAARQCAAQRPVMGRGQTRGKGTGVARPMLAQHFCERQDHRLAGVVFLRRWREWPGRLWPFAR